MCHWFHIKQHSALWSWVSYQVWLLPDVQATCRTTYIYLIRFLQLLDWNYFIILYFIFIQCYIYMLNVFVCKLSVTCTGSSADIFHLCPLCCKQNWCLCSNFFFFFLNPWSSLRFLLQAQLFIHLRSSLSLLAPDKCKTETLNTICSPISLSLLAG